MNWLESNCRKAVRDPSADIKEALKPQIKGHFAAIDCKDLPDFLAAIDLNDAGMGGLSCLSLLTALSRPSALSNIRLSNARPA